MKTTVLFIQLGTPDEPTVAATRSYLSEFLNDSRVIDLPGWKRYLLVNLIIVPFRSPKSAKAYQELFHLSDNTLPLLKYTRQLTEKISKKFQGRVNFEFAMRYGNPSIKNVLSKIKKNLPQKLIIFPLYPQYASSTSGTAYEMIMKEIGQWWVIPEIIFAGPYATHPAYIEAMQTIAKPYVENESWDHFLMSYHGLPIRHLQKNYPEKNCPDCDCEKVYDQDNFFCYKAACYATSKKLAEALNIPKDKYTVVFQSRLGKEPWIEPYASDIIQQLAGQGKKKILMLAPSFTADCLETVIEIGEEYKAEFLSAGGEKFAWVPSLNDETVWIEALTSILQPYISLNNESAQ